MEKREEKIGKKKKYFNVKINFVDNFRSLFGYY
jgi:DNA-binding transcriptional regulator GbsR (MarR family)